ncbi:Hypothetical protein R9X50_00775600 [Acrodontium crateriforme]|uniref:chitinase n=1 Tax=Acrodontium crateriforme TaxID=150365 RepID=A0AAQ3RB00_9PEZI|nr:Hypothetical protein R9X50_00775600 [Acrodontium crateriforme]
MLLLRDVLAMSSPLRMAKYAALASMLFVEPSLQQTYTTCNPTKGSCPADPALGKSLAIDFTSGASDQFTAQGVPTFDSNGASFTVAKSGDSPTLISKWYIMFGKVEVTMKAAPGAGIVSSSVLQSDDLDEIDWEWLGAQTGQVQSNYFGKGQTTTYDRAAVHSVSDTQGEFHTYTVEWTDSQIIWQIDGTTVRVLGANDAHGQYPQTPMQLKLGSWSGGDPSNAQGTIAWAQGPTDYAKGPFTMVVKSISVTDYSTGTAYSYGNESGDWESIEAAGGKVNGNAGGASPTDTSAPAITSTSSGNQPFSGTHAECTTCTTPGIGSWSPTTLATQTTVNTDLPGLPSGWSVNPTTGKVTPASGAASTSHIASSTSSPAASSAAPCSVTGYSVVTAYDQRGFLTTNTIPIGVSTAYDARGFPTTIYPSNCDASNLPFAFAAGAVLKETVPTETPSITSSDGVFLSSPSGTNGLIAAASTTTTTTTTHDSSAGRKCFSVRWFVAGWALIIAFVLG